MNNTRNTESSNKENEDNDKEDNRDTPNLATQQSISNTSLSSYGENQIDKLEGRSGLDSSTSQNISRGISIHVDEEEAIMDDLDAFLES